MIQHPRNASEFSKANACFYMFVDEETEAYVKILAHCTETTKLAYGG